MQEEIKDKILEYLKKDFKWNYGLEVLDNKYRKYYTGVTLNYITYDLLKAKYKKSDIAKVLKKLVLEKEIKSLFCPHIKKVVFEPKASTHWNFIESGYGAYNEKYFVEYMNQFIKK